MSRFFLTYLRRELSRRVRQTAFVALGLALGVGLVVTVSAASAGVKKAETGVLSGLYGVGTDLTVSGPAPLTGLAQATARCRHSTSRACSIAPGVRCTRQGPNLLCGGGALIGPAKKSAGDDEILYPPLNATVSDSTLPAVARLHDVAAVLGVLALVYQWPGGTYSVDGVSTGHSSLGPLSAASVVAGHYFTVADSDADGALVDSAYAAASNLRVGSAITIRHVRFTVIGIIAPVGASPPDVYIPLSRAQALGSPDKRDVGNLASQVNLIYVAAASAADFPAVQSEISRLLPSDTVTDAGSLPREVTGSLSTVSRLASDLGRWVSVLALIAAFVLACLLMMGAVVHRSAEFGTLKAGSNVPVTWGAVTVPLVPSITIGVIALAVVLAIVGGLLAGLFGSWRAARLRPADALRRVE